MQTARILSLAALFIIGPFPSLPAFAAPEGSLSEIETAAQTGDAEAQFQLARAILRGLGVEQDPAKAFDLMKKAADQGHPDALGGVGYFYAAGVVVQKDKATAVEWFRKGAAKGSARSQLNLGLAMVHGNGLEKDESQGLSLIDAAAEKGLADAVYAQGETYYFGQFGRDIDYSKALSLFEKAANDGNTSAQNNLGVMLRDAQGTPKNEQAAIDWFRKAAEHGLAKAQSNLGHLLDANAKDKVRRLEAIKWLFLASDQQEATAVKTLEEIAPAMPPGEHDEARRAADSFRAVK